MSDKVLSFRPAQREDVGVLQMTFIPYLTYQAGGGRSSRAYAFRPS